MWPLSNHGRPNLQKILRALALGSTYAVVRALDGVESERELDQYIEMLRFQNVSSSPTSNYTSSRRLEAGTLTYNVIGMAPDSSRVNPETGRNVYKTNFVELVSVVPAYDVKRALRAGSVSVRLEVNYELSGEERREIEKQR